ncbi:MAG: DUF4398 domain-containing protein [Myxococcales bacterium]|nr:DUF4398 domain-containing protein [Myxococcales bacterium]MCB9534382.1 DUF4398 domain-containing protein [Myxococcales bacterium]
MKLLPAGSVAALAVVMSATGAGCGPLLSTTEISDAALAVREASDVDADRFAIFEYVSAVEYLAKAREEWARSDFQHAISYAKTAREFADAAYERALHSPVRPVTVSP